MIVRSYFKWQMIRLAAYKDNCSLITPDPTFTLALAHAPSHSVMQSFTISPVALLELVITVNSLTSKQSTWVDNISVYVVKTH